MFKRILHMSVIATAFFGLGLIQPASAPAIIQSVSPIRVIEAGGTLNVETYNYAGSTNPFQELDASYDPTLAGQPWIVVIHGGSWGAGNRASAASAAAQFRAEGFQVFNIAYRLTTDYGKDLGVAGARQREDVLMAIDWVRANAAQFGLDPARGALFGYSAGGHLAMSAGLFGNGSERVKAIVSVSGVLQPHRVVTVAMSDPDVGVSGDFPTSGNKVLMNWASVAMRCPRLPTWPDCNSRWTDWLPETHISADDPPVMMFQGTIDPVVPPATGRAFKYWLDRQGVENTLIEGVNWAHSQNLAFDGGWRQQGMMTFLKLKTS